MPTLLEKITASADERLPLPPHRQPAQELARYKNFLKVETHRLKLLHRAGAGGLEICRARAAVLDCLIRHIYDAIERDAGAGFQARRTPCAIVAVGGYGRAELSPCSDIDLLFLHEGLVRGATAHPFLAALNEQLILTLWDIGLKPGNVVRTVHECVSVANGDMKSKTSLIEARLVAGDAALFKQMQPVVLAKCVRGHEDEYVAQRLADQTDRRARFGNSACMQEPNVKGGCGGLRDVQNLLWMAFFKYRVCSLAELVQREQMSGSERRQIETGYDFLLRVRNELHYLLNRPGDALTRGVQAGVAQNLGYAARTPAERVELFMRDLYTHLRNVHFITRDVERRLALVPEPRRLATLRKFIRTRGRPAAETIVDGFRLVDGEILPVSNRVFRDQPRRLMRVFLLAQQRGLRLHPDLTQLLRNQLSLVDRSFLRDAHVHETFLEILNQRGNVAPIARLMHEVGLLGKYLPEFGRLTCLVQHEFYHRYAADEHTLVCLEKLDQVWEAKAPPFSQYSESFQGIERPFVLYLALLLHDTGKAEHTGRHPELGSRIARAVAGRLDLDPSTTRTLAFLIEHHLTMAQLSQRRDLDDPAVIHAFARIVGSSENLDLLTLHTFADSQGTAEDFWTSFKDTLLWTLYRRTAAVLAGRTDFVRAEARQRELLAAEVGGLLPATIGPDEIQSHFAALPPRYFQAHSPREIAADVTHVHRFLHLQVSHDGTGEAALEPIVSWHNEPDRGYSVVTVCTWDRAGLFSKITGSLTAAGLNILTAKIFSRSDAIILDSLCVTDAQTGRLADRRERERFEELLNAVLRGEADLDALIARRRPAQPLYQGLDLDPIPTRIHFDNETSDTRTILDIETGDRVGLLYAVSLALAELGVDISLAKVCTEKGAAIDSFYVTELGAGKILAPERQKLIAAKLRAVIADLDR